MCKLCEKKNKSQPKPICCVMIPCSKEKKKVYYICSIKKFTQKKKKNSKLKNKKKINLKLKLKPKMAEEYDLYKTVFFC